MRKKRLAGESEVAPQIPAISQFIETELARLRQVHFAIADIKKQQYADCDQFLMDTVMRAP